MRLHLREGLERPAKPLKKESHKKRSSVARLISWSHLKDPKGHEWAGVPRPTTEQLLWILS